MALRDVALESFYLFTSGYDCGLQNLIETAPPIALLIQQFVTVAPIRRPAVTATGQMLF